MKRQSLISLTTAAIAVVMASGANAQEAPAKQNSIGPAIEFSGGGTSFGIKGKVGVSPQISVRPMILFGYKPSVSRSDIAKGSSTSNIPGSTTPLTLGNVPAGMEQELLNDPSFQAFADTLIGTVGSGTAYGLAVTYDFKSADSKISGYVGPRVLFGSASGSMSNSIGSFTTSTSETNIGLTAGADYAIAPDLTAGLSAAYDFSRSGTFSITTPLGTNTSQLSGGNFKMGINVGYSF
jgi:opacity protein-like surface antigen